MCKVPLCFLFNLMPLIPGHPNKSPCLGKSKIMYRFPSIAQLSGTLLWPLKTSIKQCELLLVYLPSRNRDTDIPSVKNKKDLSIPYFSYVSPTTKKLNGCLTYRETYFLKFPPNSGRKSPLVAGESLVIIHFLRLPVNL